MSDLITTAKSEQACGELKLTFIFNKAQEDVRLSAQLTNAAGPPSPRPTRQPFQPAHITYARVSNMCASNHACGYFWQEIQI